MTTKVMSFMGAVMYSRRHEEDQVMCFTMTMTFDFVGPQRYAVTEALDADDLPCRPSGQARKR